MNTKINPSIEAQKFFNNSEFTSFIENLRCRWTNEKEYEDFKEYKQLTQRVINDLNFKIEVIKMNKRPFGFNFRIEDGREYIYKASYTFLEYKRIK